MDLSEKERRPCGGTARMPGFTRVVWVLGLLHGCRTSPSMSVLGAYYPDWLFCIVGAVMAVVLIRLLLLRTGLHGWLYPPAVAYPAMLALLAFAGWLLFF